MRFLAGRCIYCGAVKGVHNGGLCPSGPFLCTCEEPDPDAIGECRVCHRKSLASIAQTSKAPLRVVREQPEPEPLGDWSVEYTDPAA